MYYCICNDVITLINHTPFPVCLLYSKFYIHKIIFQVPLELLASYRWLWMWPHSLFSLFWTDSGGTRQNRRPNNVFLCTLRACTQLTVPLNLLCVVHLGLFATTPTLIYNTSFQHSHHSLHQEPITRRGSCLHGLNWFYINFYILYHALLIPYSWKY